jgi:toxin YoeB
MKYLITIEEKAQKHMTYFEKRDRVIFNKILDLIDEISRHPFEGIGKPEALKFELSGLWSRRITKEHRLIYRVRENRVVIFSCRFHYTKN